MAHYTRQYHVLRIGSDGTSSDPLIHTYVEDTSSTDRTDRVQITVDGNLVYRNIRHQESSSSLGLTSTFGDVITNADQGIYVIWQDVNAPTYTCYTDTDAYGIQTSGCTGSQTNTYTAKITPVTAGQVGIAAALNGLSSTQASQLIEPYLQLQNGDFVALLDYGSSIMALNAATGELHWSKPASQYSAKPLYALASGGMVYREGYSPNQQLVTLDAGGNELSRIVDPKTVQSWTGNTYAYGSTVSKMLAAIEFGFGFQAISGGNLSNATAIPVSVYLQATSDCAGDPNSGSLGDRYIDYQLFGTGGRGYYVWEHLDKYWGWVGSESGMSGGLINRFEDHQSPGGPPWGTDSQYFTYSTDSAGLKGTPIFDLRLSTGKHIWPILALTHVQGNPGYVTVNGQLAPSLAPCR